jgi:nitrite reductase/ring-hydroxylating ferredoxin subunit
VTLKLAIEEAIQKAAPDLERIEAEGVAEPPPRPAGFVSVADLLGTKPAESAPRWTAVEAASDIPSGGMRAIEVAGQAILFLTIDGTFYAYRNTCPACGSSLDGATLQGTELVCPGCEQQYDIRRAGRSLTMPDRQLEPVPLLQQNGLVKVAMGRTAGPTGTAPAT